MLQVFLLRAGEGSSFEAILNFDNLLILLVPVLLGKVKVAQGLAVKLQAAVKVPSTSSTEAMMELRKRSYESSAEGQLYHIIPVMTATPSIAFTSRRVDLATSWKRILPV